MLTDNACSQLSHALVTVRIDYCNSLLYGLPDCSLSRLQRILNTAARILCNIPKFDHTTKTLLDLHWLPIRDCQNWQSRTDFTDLYMTQSSANSRTVDVVCSSRSLMKIKKSSGPSTNPCGTPDFIDAGPDVSPSTIAWN